MERILTLSEARNDLAGPCSSSRSGEARVPCARGQETFLRPRQQKLQILKQKIGTKMRKKQKQNLFCSYLFLFR